MCQVYKRWQNKLEPRWTNHTEWEAVTCIWVGGYCLIFSFSLWFFSSPNMCSCRCHACSHVWFCIFLLVVLLNTYYKGGTAYWGLGSQRTTERDVISVPMELRGQRGKHWPCQPVEPASVELKGPAGEALTMPTSRASVHGTQGASGGSIDHANQLSQRPWNSGQRGKHWPCQPIEPASPSFLFTCSGPAYPVLPHPQTPQVPSPLSALSIPLSVAVDSFLKRVLTSLKVLSVPSSIAFIWTLSLHLSCFAQNTSFGGSLSSKK